MIKKLRNIQWLTFKHAFCQTLLKIIMITKTKMLLGDLAGAQSKTQLF